jgi:hypothetical protein
MLDLRLFLYSKVGKQRPIGLDQRMHFLEPYTISTSRYSTR